MALVDVYGYAGQGRQQNFLNNMVARDKLSADITKERIEFEDEQKKKGLWGSIGSGVGGLGMGLLAGALGPAGLLAAALTSAAASGLGSAGGQALANAAVGSEGGKFFANEREDFKDYTRDSMWANAGTSALTSGLMKYASGLKAIKGAESAREAAKVDAMKTAFDSGMSASDVMKAGTTAYDDYALPTKANVFGVSDDESGWGIWKNPFKPSYWWEK
jgi:hypothetical protein